MRRWLPYLALLPACLAVASAPVLLAYRQAEPPPNAAPVVEQQGADAPRPPDADDMAALAKADPVAFLDAALARYRRDVRGYRCTLHKQETVGGKLQPPEVIDVSFRESPFAARLAWKQGGPMADRLLYAAGENDDQLVLRVRGPLLSRLVPLVRRDPLGDDAKAASRYPLPEFGMGKAVERSRDAWAKARDAGRLSVTSRGVVPVPELDGRPCLVLERTCDPPEEDGLTDLWLAFDAETRLQTGSRLTDGEGRTIGRYLFRSVEVNPTFAGDEFAPAGLGRP